MNEPTPPDTQEVAKDSVFHYTLVVAEVIFDVDGEVGSQRIQSFSKSDTMNFPAARLKQCQNVSALQAKQNLVGAPNFQALDVIILNLHPLGWMTDEEFWSGQAPDGVKIVAPEASNQEGTMSAPPGGGVGTPVQDNTVVPFKQS